MIKILSGTVLEAAGLLLIIYRMKALHYMAGGTRVRIGQILGIDRVGNSLLVFILIGIALILIGNLLTVFGIRQLRWTDTAG